VTDPTQSFLQYQTVGSLHQITGTAFNSHSVRSQFDSGKGGNQSIRGGRGGQEQHRDRRPQPVDKPKSKHSIPGCKPWLLVYTKLGRRFVYNPVKSQSYWRIPEKLKDGILAFDQQRIKEKAETLTEGQESKDLDQATRDTETPRSLTKEQEPSLGDSSDEGSSEYEEVTDDDEEAPSKRPRLEVNAREEPIEFNEDDIAYQLAAMGQEYGLDPGEYDDNYAEDWPEGAEGLELTHEDALALFTDLLNDLSINPYRPWEMIIEDGKLVDDTRYTALNNMKARKEVWEEWSREKIKELREQKAKEEKKDPRIPYLAFLQKCATPKLYWSEFKRKYRKDAEMRDTSLSDKDREKWYREHINRLKLTQSTLKSDFINLLKSQSLSVLNNTTLPSHLPPTVLSDIKYISLSPEVRDPLIEEFVATLPPPPETSPDEEDEEIMKGRSERERRRRALEDRQRHVAEAKRRQRKNLELGKDKLREEEAEIAKAMNVTKKGLRDHLMDETKVVPSETPH
jgi:FF domain